MTATRPAFHFYSVLLFILATLAAGCSGPTEVDRDNRRLVDSILTAITMKNTGWLEDAEKRAEQRYSDGHLTQDEYEQLLSIIETAKAGEWPTAEKMGYEFRNDHPFVKEGQ